MRVKMYALCMAESESEAIFDRQWANKKDVWQTVLISTELSRLRRIHQAPIFLRVEDRRHRFGPTISITLFDIAPYIGADVRRIRQAPRLSIWSRFKITSQEAPNEIRNISVLAIYFWEFIL